MRGSVSTEGDRLLITARLEEVSTGRNVWAANYDRDLHGVLALYGEVARAITQEVEAELTPEEEARLSYARTVDPEAYNLYLRGRFYWNRRSPADLLRAVEYFQQALEMDSSSALAYAGLADAYMLFPQYYVPGLSPAEAYVEAERFARGALERDSTLGEARTALAHLRFLAHRDWSGAESEFLRALDLSPGYAVLHQWYGEYLRARGQVEEGLAEVRRAFQLAPQEPVISNALAMGLWCAGHYDEAAEQAQYTLDVDSDYAPGYYALALARLGQSRFSDMEAAGLAAGLPAAAVSAVRGVLDGETTREDAIQAISEFSAYMDPFQVAVLYAAVGAKDPTFASLGLAEAQGNVNALVFLNSAPIFEFLRDDPRYELLLLAFGVPAEGR